MIVICEIYTIDSTIKSYNKSFSKGTQTHTRHASQWNIAFLEGMVFKNMRFTLIDLRFEENNQPYKYNFKR